MTTGRFPRAASVPLLAALAGCNATDVDGSDKDVIFPTLRAVFDLAEQRESPGPEPVRRSHFDHGVEVEASGTIGEMDLDSGIGDTDYRVIHGSVAYRIGFANRRFEAHGLFGMAVDRVALSSNPAADADEAYLGPMVGIEARLRLRDWLAPYLRLTSSLLEEGSNSQQLEAGLLFTPFERGELFVAYRNWDAEYGNLLPNGADLDVEWEGAVLGFGIRL